MVPTTVQNQARQNHNNFQASFMVAMTVWETSSQWTPRNGSGFISDVSFPTNIQSFCAVSISKLLAFICIPSHGCKTATSSTEIPYHHPLQGGKPDMRPLATGQLLCQYLVNHFCNSENLIKKLSESSPLFHQTKPWPHSDLLWSGSQQGDSEVKNGHCAQGKDIQKSEKKNL